MSYRCYCYLNLLRGAIGWSVVCDCGTSGHTHLSLTCTAVSRMVKLWRNIEPAQVESPLDQVYLLYIYSKTCVNGHSKIDKLKILMTNGSLMKVESITECSSSWSILQ